MRTKLSLAILAILAITTTQSFAQSTTTSATGTVLEPMTVSGTNLAFGTSIFPGINKSVARTDAGAAQFDIDGETGKEVTATFTLPSALTHNTDGTTTLPISFSATDAGHSTSSTGQGTATAFDPSATLTTTLGTTSGLLYIWLGGTVQPASSQKAGAYSGDITLEMAYTGN